jgi:hypothetical protein
VNELETGRDRAEIRDSRVKDERSV